MSKCGRLVWDVTLSNFTMLCKPAQCILCNCTSSEKDSVAIVAILSEHDLQILLGMLIKCTMTKIYIIRIMYPLPCVRIESKTRILFDNMTFSCLIKRLSV